MGLSNQRLLFYMLAFLICILPLLYIPTVFNPFEFPKFLFFVAMCQLAVIVYAFNVLLRQDGIPPIQLTLLTKLIIAFGIVSFIANISGLDPKISLMGSTWRHQGFITLMSSILLYLITTTLQAKNLSGRFMSIISVSAFLVCTIALWHAFTLLILKDPTIPNFQGRIVGTLGNPNVLGGYLSMIVPFLLLNWKNKLQAFTLLLTIFTILFTQSRSALAAAIFVIVCFIVVKLKNKINVRKIFLFLFATLFLFISILFATLPEKKTLTLGQQAIYCLFLLDRKNPVENAIFELYDRYPILLDRASFCEHRFSIWVEGIRAVRIKPLLGYGQENFELIFPKDRGIKVDNAHNIFLDVAVSSGLVGLFLFVAILIVGIRKATLPVKLSIFAFLICGFFNPLSIAQLSLFWFLLGLSTHSLTTTQKTT